MDALICQEKPKIESLKNSSTEIQVKNTEFGT